MSGSTPAATGSARGCTGPTRRYAETAPRGEVKLYPEGHFEIYVGDAFERVLADQLEFLGRVLATGDDAERAAR